MLQILGLDHIVLVVLDVERSLAWWCDELGLDGVRVEEWRRGEAPFPSVRVDATTIIDLLEGQPTGEGVLDHLCLVLAPVDLDALAATGRFEVVGGPGPRFGAQGTGASLYVRNPDGLTVELRHYGTPTGAVASP